MNGDPYSRNPGAPERRVVNRSGAAPRPAEEPQMPREEAPVSAPRSSGARRSHRDEPVGGSNKGLLWTIIIALIVVVVGVAGWAIWSNSKSSATGIDSSRYQAVFLSNGQIYFGKLSSFNEESFKITSVYYPQAQTTGEDAAADVQSEQSNISLFRITDGVHGPDDEMIVMKNQILYYENLQANSKVTQLIEQNKAQ